VNWVLVPAVCTVTAVCAVPAVCAVTDVENKVAEMLLQCEVCSGYCRSTVIDCSSA
jgi:hypothetical protein